MIKGLTYIILQALVKILSLSLVGYSSEIVLERLDFELKLVEISFIR